jgi:ribonuclease HI
VLNKEIDYKAILDLLAKDQTSTEWTAWTDGSGHTDRYGGYGVKVLGHFKLHTSAGALLGTTVNRAEFTGLLEAMQIVHEQMIARKDAGLSLYPAKKTTMRWYTDRENLVFSVLINPQTQQPYYNRKTDADLWCRFEYYARSIQVFPVHIARNSHPFHAECDALASRGRKAYIRWIAHTKAWWSKKLNKPKKTT